HLDTADVYYSTAGELRPLCYSPTRRSSDLGSGLATVRPASKSARLAHAEVPRALSPGEDGFPSRCQRDYPPIQRSTESLCPHTEANRTTHTTAKTVSGS